MPVFLRFAHFGTVLGTLEGTVLGTGGADNTCVAGEKAT
jgi:hypothetical protein